MLAVFDSFPKSNPSLVAMDFVGLLVPNLHLVSPYRLYPIGHNRYGAKKWTTYILLESLTLSSIWFGLIHP